MGASLTANIATAEPTATARIVAAWSAVAFAIPFELLLEQRRHQVGEQDDTPAALRTPNCWARACCGAN